MPRLSAEALRSEFDRSFALPLANDTRDEVDFIALRIGDRSYALSNSELAGVTVGRRATPLPSPDPALAGLVGVRGALVAVFDLGVLVGVRSSAVESRWLALSARDTRIALAFDELEGYRSAPRAALRAVAARRDDYVEQALEDEGRIRPIVSVNGIVSSLTERADRLRSGKGI
jgi:purine-binding chemotaxis protein CheW